MSVKSGQLYRYTRKAHFAYMNLINIKYAFAPTPTVGQAWLLGGSQTLQVSITQFPRLKNAKISYL